MDVVRYLIAEVTPPPAALSALALLAALGAGLGGSRCAPCTACPSRVSELLDSWPRAPLRSYPRRAATRG